MAKTETPTEDNYPLPADWRGKVMSQIRELIQEVDPEITEEVKWKTASNPDGVLAWYRDGMITTGEIYKKHIRLAFSKGPALKDHDPSNLINSYRAMLIHEEDTLDVDAFKKLIQAAVALNQKEKI
jgi:hypothetical protein